KEWVAYEIDGVRTEQFPVDAVMLDRAEPIYETISGWTESTRAITEYSQLNAGARSYIKRLEEIVGVPAKIISTGPRREETLVLQDFLAH
ncbi:MAG: adenylosuccinate synthetase, partial [Chloroflexi bacterium]|nr:adenylosuccinate synthetase [Chloroflexota bacterium]